MVANLKNYLVKSLVVLGLSTGEQVQATPNHPFYTHGEYVEAAALHVGDTLFTADGRCITVAAVREKDTTARVYNLTVADNSNYFVGMSDVLVHNDCMAKVLAKSYEGLVARVDKLSPELKAAFMTDFEKAGTDVLNVLNEGKGVEAWEMLHKAGCKFVKTDAGYLAKFKKQSLEVQKQIAKFTDENANNSTLKKFLDDVETDADFAKLVKNPENDELVKGFVGHKGDNLTTDFYLEKQELLDELGYPDGGKARAWLERSEKLAGFKNLMANGRKYGENMVAALTQGNKQLLVDLGQKMGKDLSGYTVFNEVELWVDEAVGQYMRADAVLVKFVDDKIDDVIILESKISSGTDFTVRQKQGWGKIASEGKIKIKSTKRFDKNVSLEAGKTLTIERSQVKKVSDHGSPEGGFTISDVDVSSYKNFKPKK